MITRRDDHLTRLAATVLAAAGAPQTAEGLAANLAGGRSPGRNGPQPGLVQRLESALANDERFMRDAAGKWGLASWRREGAGTTPLLAEYVVVDATVPPADRPGVVRLAGVKLRAGQIVEPYNVRFLPLSSPARSDPRQPLRLTGAGVGGRSVAEVLPEIRAWLSDAVIVGQDIAGAVDMLNEQTARLGQVPLVNRVLEVSELARLLLPGVHRPGLSRLAAALGVTPRLRHPSLGDARLIAEVLLSLLRQLDERREAVFPLGLEWLGGGKVGGGAEEPGAGGPSPWDAVESGSAGGPAAALEGAGSATPATPATPAVPAASDLAVPVPAVPAAPMTPAAGAALTGAATSGRGVPEVAMPGIGTPVHGIPDVGVPGMPGVEMPALAATANGSGSGYVTGSVRLETSETGLASNTTQALPVAPGVYVFRDHEGRVLFVGAAESLRDRITAHLTPDADGGTPEAPWAGQAVAVDHTPVDCELDALLLAAERLRSLHPAYRSRGARRSSPVLRFIGGVFLRVEPGHAVDAGGAFHFGPYRSENELRHTVQTVRRVFQIRTCSRRLPARRAAMRIPCERLAQHLCPAPCAEMVTPEQYGVLVEFALHFVAAGKQPTLEALQARLDTLAADGESSGWEYGILAECRTRLLRVRKEYHPVPGGLGGGAVIMTYPTADGRVAVFYVQDGRFLARFRVSESEASDASLRALVQAYLSVQVPAPELDLAQTNVLLRWLFQHAGEPALAAVPPTAHPEAIAGLVVDAVRRHFEQPSEATSAPPPSPAF